MRIVNWWSAVNCLVYSLSYVPTECSRKILKECSYLTFTVMSTDRGVYCTFLYVHVAVYLGSTVAYLTWAGVEGMNYPSCDHCLNTKNYGDDAPHLPQEARPVKLQNEGRWSFSSIFLLLKPEGERATLKFSQTSSGEEQTLLVMG